MKKLIILTSICFIFSMLLQAQNKGKVQLDVEIPVKFSIGNDSRQIINYRGDTMVNLPYYDSYRNPVYGFNLNILYGLSESFKIGAGTGLYGEFFEATPVKTGNFSGEYYNRLMLPIYAKLRYQKNFKKKVAFIADLNAGYQYYENRIARDTTGYYFIDKGGLMGGVDLGAGYRTSKYVFSFKLGYEMNIYNHAYRLDYGDHPVGINKYDILEFKTYYRLLKVTFGINLL